MRRGITEIAEMCFRRIGLVAFLYSGLVITLIAYSYHARFNQNSSLIITLLILSPIFILGLVVVAIVYYGRKAELGSDIEELLKLKVGFRKVTVLYALAVLVIVGSLILLDS